MGTFDALVFSIMPTLSMGTADLSWDVAAGPTSNYSPNVLSELKYRSMDTQTYGVVAEALIPMNEDYAIVVSMSSRSGDMDGGSYSDSDFSGDGRTREFSRSVGNADDGSVEDNQFSVGLASSFLSDDFLWRASIGYIKQKQAIKMSDGQQVIWRNAETGANAEFPAWGLDGLDSEYSADWQGYWAGLQLSLQLERGRIVVGGKYLTTDFEAVGKWNLREDLAQPRSFDQYDTGYGTEYSLEYAYPVWEQWEVCVRYEVTAMHTTNGFDRLYFSNGESYVSKLNTVAWDWEAYSIGMRLQF